MANRARKQAPADGLALGAGPSASEVVDLCSDNESSNAIAAPSAEIQLVDMGFEVADVRLALAEADGDFDRAIDVLTDMADFR